MKVEGFSTETRGEKRLKESRLWWWVLVLCGGADEGVDLEDEEEKLFC